VDSIEAWDSLKPAKPCPRCGWAPVVVELIEIEDWDHVGRHGLR
jgi:hypothetical protein